MTAAQARTLIAAMGLLALVHPRVVHAQTFTSPEPARDPARHPSTSSDRALSGGGANEPDGSYGRFDGDVDVGILLGTELGPERVDGALRLSLHYFSMAGLAVGFANGLGPDSRAERTLSLGVDLRPLFLPRWSNDLESGPPLLDLTIDSFSIGAGAFWSEPPDGSFGSRRGFEGVLGIGVPLLAAATGPWIQCHGVVRWREPIRETSSRAEGRVLVLLGWHQVVKTGIADAASAMALE